jgi:hypothetical protein
MIDIASRLLAETKTYRVVAMTIRGKKEFKVLADSKEEAKDLAWCRAADDPHFSILEINEGK